jgi:hypothetical protein
MPKKTEKMTEQAGGKVNVPRQKTQPTLVVTQSQKISYDELMKRPKAQLIKELLTVPDNRARFVLDVVDQTRQGKDIITLMNRLEAADPNTLKAVSEILGSLARIVAECPSDRS